MNKNIEKFLETGVVTKKLQNDKRAQLCTIWSTVILDDGTETNYSVSPLGLVRNNITGKILKPSYRKGGYLCVKIQLGKDDYYKIESVHRLVANAYIGGKTNLKNEVDHIDGVKYHNYTTNLEWVSHSEQILRAYKLGLITPKYGEDVPTSKYSNEFVIKLCGFMEQGHSLRTLATLMGVEKNKSFKYLVDGIRRKHRWNFISKNFNIPRMRAKVDRWDDETVELLCKLIESGAHKNEMIKYVKKRLPSKTTSNILGYINKLKNGEVII